MEEKFIRVNSPLAFLVTVCFDVAALFFLSISVYGIIKERNVFTVLSLVICLTVQIIAIMVTVTQRKKGVKFYKDKAEFTFLDENNIYEYKDVNKIETHKDTGASLKKNFVDRYSSVIIYLNDGTVATVELGITTKKTLLKIEKEFVIRI